MGTDGSQDGNRFLASALNAKLTNGTLKDRIPMRKTIFLITMESPLRYEASRPKVDTCLFDNAPAFVEKTRAEWFIAERLFTRPKDTPPLTITEIELDLAMNPAPVFTPPNPLKT